MSEQLYRRCRHVTPNGRQYWKSKPGIPHPIDGSMSNTCYGYAPVDGVLMTEAEWVETLALRCEEGTDDMGVVIETGNGALPEPNPGNYTRSPMWDVKERGNP